MRRRQPNPINYMPKPKGVCAYLCPLRAQIPIINLLPSKLYGVNKPDRREYVGARMRMPLVMSSAFGRGSERGVCVRAPA